MRENIFLPHLRTIPAMTWRDNNGDNNDNLIMIKGDIILYSILEVVYMRSEIAISNNHHTAEIIENCSFIHTQHIIIISNKYIWNVGPARVYNDYVYNASMNYLWIDVDILVRRACGQRRGRWRRPAPQRIADVGSATTQAHGHIWSMMWNCIPFCNWIQ